MAEGAEEFVFRNRRHHGGCDGDITTHAVWCDLQLWCPDAVKPQISQGEVDLTQGGQPGIKGPARLQFLEFGFGQGVLGLPVPRHPHQRCVVQAPVLHELAGQFHGIPFHVADPRSLGLVHRGEHVLQTMAEFMEEGFDLFEAHQAWRVSDRWGLIADQVGDGKHKRAIAQPTTAQAFIHPGTTSLGSRATEGIEIERCDGLTTCCIDPEEANVLMPDRRLSIGWANVHLEEALAQAEQPIQHLGQWEPGSQRFLVQIKTLLAEFFRPERQVPWGQTSGFMRTVSLGAGPEICQFLLRCGVGGSAQFLKQ